MLTVLEKLEFVSIEPNPPDGRSKVARATIKGSAFLIECMECMGQELAPVVSELTTEPFLEALPHLTRIREALNQDRE